tara:strand:- start:852 stop:1154 length:303 start_codon:yes stop_codon:yes gene_type:complete
MTNKNIIFLEKTLLKNYVWCFLYFAWGGVIELGTCAYGTPTGNPDIPEHIRIAKKLFRVADQVAVPGQGNPDHDDPLENGQDSSYLQHQSQKRVPSGLKQ